MKLTSKIKLELRPVETARDVASARRLFLEYAESLHFNLCFQNFDEELKRLPGEYSSPSGRLLLARANGKLAGCVALHHFADGVCEMKRLYVRPKFRGLGLGRLLAEKIVTEATLIDYQSMRLDTINTMNVAIKLYEEMGFVRIAPYRPNPIEGAVYMELTLRQTN